MNAPAARRLRPGPPLWGVVAGLTAACALVFGSTTAAFTASTTTGASMTAGTVVVTSDAAGGTLLTVSDALPGATGTTCVLVTYAGNLPAVVRLYGTGAGALAPYLALTVDLGSGVPPGDGSCTGFAPTENLYTGTLADLLTHSAFSTGIGGFNPPAPAQSAWYRFTWTLDAATPGALQGTSATANISWEAHDHSTPGPSPYQQLLLADGAASLWRLEETAGPTAADATGAVSGTFSGSPALGYPDGRTGDHSCAHFDGTDDHVGAGPTYPFVGHAPFSVEVRARLDRITALSPVLVSAVDYDNGGLHGWLLGVHGQGYLPGHIGFERWAGSASQDVIAAASITPGAWFHVVATYDGSVSRLYVDGAAAGQDATDVTMPAASQPLRIGGIAPNAFVTAFNGSMCDVALYNRALTAPEVTAHYQASLN